MSQETPYGITTNENESRNRPTIIEIRYTPAYRRSSGSAAKKSRDLFEETAALGSLLLQQGLAGW